MLHLVTGRAGSGKSTYCLKAFSKAVSDSAFDPACYLIVPEQFTMQAERKLLTMRSKELSGGMCPGLLEDEVLSFRRLTYRILSRFGGLSKTTLNPSGRVMLLVRVLRSISPQLQYFRSWGENPFESAKLLSLLEEFEKYRVTAQTLRTLAAGKEADGTLQGKLLDLSLIYSAYEEQLCKEYMNENDIYSICAERMERYQPLKGARVWVDAFTGFTAVEYEVIAAMLKQCEQVVVCLCMDRRGEPVFKGIRNTYDRLCRLAQETGCDIKRTVLDVPEKSAPRYRKNPYLGYLEKHFCHFGGPGMPGVPKNISLIECRTIYSEVIAGAEEIVRLVRKEHYRYHEIAVMVRNPEDYEKIVRAVFTQYGIPFFVDVKKDVTDNPLIRLILGALEIISGNWQYQSVFDFLKTGLYFESRAETDLLENEVLAKGLRGESMWKQETNPSCRSLYQDISAFGRELKKCKTLKDCCRALCTFLERTNVRDKLRQKAEALRAGGFGELADEYFRIWNIVMEVLKQTAVFLGDAAIHGLPEAASMTKLMLQNGFSQYKAGFIPQSSDSVQICSADRSRSHEVRALFVMGANEGIFPAVFSDDGLLRDRERAVFAAHGVDLADDSRARAYKESYMLYSVLTAPAEALRVSYPLENGGGEGLRPSAVIVRRLRQLFPDLPLQSDFLPASLSEAPLKAPAPQMLPTARMISVSEKNGRCQTAALSVQTPHMGEQIRRLFGIREELTSTVSRIEAYNRCPYAFFLQYGLEAKPRREAQLSLTDIGSLMHLLIDKASVRAAEAAAEGSLSAACDAEACEALIRSVYRESMEELRTAVFDLTARSRYLTKRLLKSAASAFYAISRQISAGSFIPVAFEVPFGMEHSILPAVRIPLSGRTNALQAINLTGRIDRFDLFSDGKCLYVRLVDYKSSGKDISAGDVWNGVKLQLVAYADALTGSEEAQQAVRKLARERGIAFPAGAEIKTAGALYFTLQDDIVPLKGSPALYEIKRDTYKMSGFLLDREQSVRAMAEHEETDVIPVRFRKDGSIAISPSTSVPAGGFSALSNKMREVVADSVSSLLQGEIAPRPRIQENACPCDYCAFGSICGNDLTAPDSYIRLPRISVEEAWNYMGGTAGPKSESAPSAGAGLEEAGT